MRPNNYYTDIAERLKQFGLELSLEKTGIIEFGRFAEENQTKKGKRNLKHLIFLDSHTTAAVHGTADLW